MNIKFLETQDELNKGAVEAIQYYKKENEKLSNLIDDLKKEGYVRENSKGITYTTHELALEVGFTKAIGLDDSLERLGIQFRAEDGARFISKEYDYRGLVCYRDVELMNGEIECERRWTEVGKHFIIRLYARGVNNL